jgi:ribonuclease E
MEEPRNQRAVEDRLREAMKMDRARIQIGRLSRFGLLEMSRQRLRPSLGDSSHEVCPRCQGIGSIRTVESMALAILRLIGEEARKDRTSKVIAEVPVEVATYLINEKREWLRTLEDKSDVELLIVPNLNIDTPEYSIRRVRDDEAEAPEFKRLSYQMPTPAKVPDATGTREKQGAQEPAAVPTFLPTTAAPIVVQAPVATPATATQPATVTVTVPAGPQLGIFVRLWRWLFGAPQPDAAPVREEQQGDRERGGRRRDRDRNGRGGRDRGDRDRGEREAGGERSDRNERGGRDRGRGRDRDRDRNAARDTENRGADGRPAEQKPAEAQQERRGERADEGQQRRGGRDDSRRRGRGDGRDRGENRERNAPLPVAAESPAPVAPAGAATEAAASTAPDQGAEMSASASFGTPQSYGAATPPGAAEDGAPPREGARRGRRRGRRGRRGGAGRDLAGGAAGLSVDGPNPGSDDLFADGDGDDLAEGRDERAATGSAQSASGPDPAPTAAGLPADAVAAESTAAAATSAPVGTMAVDVPPPPPVNAQISWTGLAPAEPAEQTSVVQAEAEARAPEIQAPEIQAAEIQAAEPRIAEAAVAAGPAADLDAPVTPPAPASESIPGGEKKVVWSSGPSSGSSSFGSGTRRDY